MSSSSIARYRETLRNWGLSDVLSSLVPDEEPPD